MVATELNKLLEEVLGEKKCPQKHGGSDAISMTANTLSSWYLPLTNRDPKLLRMSFTPLVFTQNIVFLYIVVPSAENSAEIVNSFARS